MRPSHVEVDLNAISHNSAIIAEAVAPAMLCAVVKADGKLHSARKSVKVTIGGCGG